MPSEFVYSPSQISEWSDCPRKWAWSKVDRIKPPQHPSAALGDKVHKCLEDYLEGKEVDHVTNPLAASLAMGAVGHLPAPKSPGLAIERKWKAKLSTADHEWNGRIDWLKYASGVVIIGDHKTTSNIAAWGKTADDLSGDTQAIVYSKWAIKEFFVEEVNLQWTYIQTKGAKRVEPVHLKLSVEHVNEKFAAIDAVASEISAARVGVTSAIELPYNPDTCDKYGGCPYQFKCNLTPLQRMKSIMSNGAESLFAKLQNKSTMPSPPPEMEVQRINPPEFQPPPVIAEEEGGPVDPVPVKKTRAPRTTKTIPDMPAAIAKAKSDPPPAEKLVGRVVNGAVFPIDQPIPRGAFDAKLTLFVGCTPVSGWDQTILDLSTILEEAREAIKSEDGLDDPSFADFGKGPGLLSCHVESIVKARLACGPVTLTADTRLRETSMVLSRLLTLAKGGVVIRGL